MPETDYSALVERWRKHIAVLPPKWSIAVELNLAADAITALLAENERLKAWTSDLQSGMYVNCVYCGHRYGPGETTPVSMADALKAHIEQCPQHPMSALRSALAAATAREAELRKDAERFAWWFGPIDKYAFINTYMRGMSENWTVDQWRVAIDAAIAQSEPTEKR